MPRNPAIVRAASLVQKITRRWPVTLSNSVGDITPGFSAAVPDAPGFVYVVMPSGSVLKALNGRIPAATGRRAWAGYEPHNPTLFRILDFNASYATPGAGGGPGSGGGAGGGGTVGAHHWNHEFLNPTGGWDVTYSQARQLMPLRLSVATGLAVRVEPTAIQTASGWALSTAATLDLAAYVPASGSRFVLVYLDSAGVLSARAGITLPGALSYGAIPAAEPGEVPLAAVRLAAGQTDIVETLARADIVDLRFGRAADSGGGVQWFNVRDYGAVGDASTDDTDAFTAAIADLSAAGGGRLYVPAGAYLTTGGFNLPVNCMVVGDGDYWVASQIICTSATAVLFQVDAQIVNFQDLYLLNTAATPTAGSAIRGLGTVNGQHINLQRVTIDGFYDGAVYLSGSNWVVDSCWVGNVRRYGLFVSNEYLADQGDWGVINTIFTTSAHNPDAAIRIESSGGGRIVNCKINGGAAGFAYGVDLAVADATTILLIGNSSFENVRTNAIRLANAAAITYYMIVVNGCQFGMYQNGTNPAILAAADALGAIRDLVITDNIFYSLDAPPFAIDLTNIDNAVVAGNVLDGYGAALTTTTCTNIDTGSAYVLPDTAVTPGSYTSADITVDAQGRLTAAASGSAGLQVLMSGDSPPDPLTNDADDDWLYG